MASIIAYFYEAVTKKHITCYDVVNLYFEKERYTPYTVARFTVLNNRVIEDLCEVQITIGGKVIHQGVADSMEAKMTDDGYYSITVYSRSFTAALSVNQPIPKINSNVNLNDILTSNISNLRVASQADTKTVNYVYILDRDTLWDAVVAYAIKAYSNYPYIRNSNTVMVSPPTSPTAFSHQSNVLELSQGVNLSNMISQINMKDYNGDYSTYQMTNDYAVNRYVIRRKTIELDKQWLAEPNTALSKRIDFSNRAVKYKAAKIEGYNGEDLFDKMTITKGSTKFIDEKYIHRIIITGNKDGIVTKLYTYFDGYSGDI